VDLFVDYFSKNDLSAFLTGSALAEAGGSPGAAASEASAAADAPAEPAKEEKKEEWGRAIVPSSTGSVP
jgi:ribosomal protein L12E/L44/L45/RPP1/RPP2